MRWRRRHRPESVTYLTREGCTQCATYAPLVARLAAEAGIPLQERDIDAAPPDERRRYTDRVPVVLLDGREHASWTVSERALRRALQG